MNLEIEIFVNWGLIALALKTLVNFGYKKKTNLFILIEKSSFYVDIF